jgi:hypothetical protein
MGAVSLEDLSFVELVNEMVKFMESNQKMNNHWYLLHHFFYIELEKASGEQIREAIDLNYQTFNLPFHIVCDLFQRLILVEENRRENFSKFAEFLRIYGNSWHYLADYFDRVASRESL